MALNHADTVLSWAANHTEKEMPPRWMWIFGSGKTEEERASEPYPPVFGDPLDEHWDNVKAARKERLNGGDDDDDEPQGRMLTNPNPALGRR